MDLETKASNGSEPRRTYETDLNRTEESKVADKLSMLWKREAIKLKPFAAGDIAILANDEDPEEEGTIKAFVEIKVRTNSMSSYPTYMISLHKLQELSHLSEFSGLPSILVVQWKEDLGYWLVPEDVGVFDIKMGGTTQRNDPQDMEPCVHIPIEDFVVLESSRPIIEGVM